MGRPSKYSEKIADEICDRLAQGESLLSICEDEHLPNRLTVTRWLREDKHEGFRNKYARAREDQADYLVDEIQHIADDARNDWMEKKFGKEYETVFNREHYERSKLRIEARKWYAGKVAPKKYGEKIQQEVTGADGAALVPSITVTIKEK